MATPSLRQRWTDIICKAETSFMESLIDHYATTECNLYEENTEIEQELELVPNNPSITEQTKSSHAAALEKTRNITKKQEVLKERADKKFQHLTNRNPRNPPRTIPDPEDTIHHPTTTQITGTNGTNQILTTEAQGTQIPPTINEEALPLTHIDPTLKDSPTKDNGLNFQIQPKPTLRQPHRVFPTKALETQDADPNPPSN